MHQPTYSKILRSFDSVELFTLGLSVLAGVISEKLLPLAAFLGLGFFLVRLGLQKRVHFFLPIDLPILVLLIMLTFSVFVVTALPDKSIPQGLRLLGSVWLFYAIARWGRVSLRRILMLGSGLVSIGLAMAVGGLFTVDWFAKFNFVPKELIKTLTPTVADTIDPNVFAGSLVLIDVGLITGLVFGWRALKLWQRLVLGFLCLFMTGVLALTQSRGAFLGFGMAMLVLVILRFKRGWLILPASLILVIGTVAFWGPTQFLNAFNQAQSNASTPEVRLDIWSRAAFMIEDFPFTGVGIGTFNDVVDSLYPFFISRPGTTPHAHNLFLQIAVDLGIPGVIAWIWLWGYAIYSSWRLFKQGKIKTSILQTTFGALLLTTQVALGTHGLLDAVTWGTRPAVLVWAIWGLGLAARNYF